MYKYSLALPEQSEFRAYNLRYLNPWLKIKNEQRLDHGFTIKICTIKREIRLFCYQNDKP